MAAESDVTLRMLRRIDPTAQAVCHTTKHAAVYRFSGGQWLRSDIQGPLYLAVTLDGSLKIIVLNRHGRGDFVQATNTIHDTQHEGAFFMYSTKPANEIYGIWFPSIHESTVFIAAMSNTKTIPAPPALQSKSIVSILQQAVGTIATPLVACQKYTLPDIFSTMRHELSALGDSSRKLSPDEFLELMQVALRNDRPLLAGLTLSFNSGE